MTQPHPTHLIIGIDPGHTTGIGVLRVDTIEGKVRLGATNVAGVVQCDPYSVAPIVRAYALGFRGNIPFRVYIAIEKFVIGNRSGANSSPRARAETIDLIGEMKTLAAAYSWPLFERSAGNVKPWATDKRLARADITERTTTMRHARDAFRHALYAAHHLALIHDPMTTTAGTQATSAVSE